MNAIQDTLKTLNTDQCEAIKTAAANADQLRAIYLAMGWKLPESRLHLFEEINAGLPE